MPGPVHATSALHSIPYASLYTFIFVALLFGCRGHTEWCFSSSCCLAGSGIAIFIALVIIGVALFFAYKYYLRYKKKKGETAVEAPYQGGYHQGQMATGVPAASMKPDPAYQTTQYESNAMSDPSTAPPPLPSGDPNTLYQAAPAAPEQSPYTLYHPGAQQPAPPQYGQPPAQYGQPSAQNGQPPVQYGAAAPAAAAYPYANTAGYPSGPQHNSPAV